MRVEQNGGSHPRPAAVFKDRDDLVADLALAKDEGFNVIVFIAARSSSSNTGNVSSPFKRMSTLLAPLIGAPVNASRVFSNAGCVTASSGSIRVGGRGAQAAQNKIAAAIHRPWRAGGRRRTPGATPPSGSVCMLR
jgi:hypothetical protein